jgi:hypothetical protein
VVCRQANCCHGCGSRTRNRQRLLAAHPDLADQLTRSPLALFRSATSSRRTFARVCKFGMETLPSPCSTHPTSPIRGRMPRCAVYCRASPAAELFGQWSAAAD